MQELADERRAVETALEAAGMEAFVFETDAGAQPGSAVTTYREALLECDVYLGVFASGWGDYTRDEFETAVRAGLPLLLYQRELRGGEGRDRRLEDFLEQAGHVEEGDLGTWAWVGRPGLADLVGIHDVFDPEAPLPGGQNFYRWGTPEVTDADEDIFNQEQSSVIDDATRRFAELRDELNATIDPNEIADLVGQAEEILADQVVIIPLYARPSVAVVWADELAGYRHNVSAAGDLWNVETWYRVTGSG